MHTHAVYVQIKTLFVEIARCTSKALKSYRIGTNNITHTNRMVWCWWYSNCISLITALVSWSFTMFLCLAHCECTSSECTFARCWPGLSCIDESDTKQCYDVTELSDGDSTDVINPARQPAPPVPFEGEFQTDVELMKQMGLPLGFLRSPRDLEEVGCHICSFCFVPGAILEF